MNLELAADLLEAKQFRVWRAQNAEDALAMLGQLNPDLVLMDVSLARVGWFGRDARSEKRPGDTPSGGRSLDGACYERRSRYRVALRL